MKFISLLMIALIGILAISCIRPTTKNALIDTTCVLACGSAETLGGSQCSRICVELPPDARFECSLACDAAIKVGGGLCVDTCETVIRKSL